MDEKIPLPSKSISMNKNMVLNIHRITLLKQCTTQNIHCIIQNTYRIVQNRQCISPKTHRTFQNVHRIFPNTQIQ